MSGRTAGVFAAGAFVMALVQFFAAMGGPGVAVAAGFLLPLISLGVTKVFEVELENPWLAVAPPVAASVAGILLWGLSRASLDRLYWAAPMLAAALAAAVVWWRNRDARRCALCNGGLSSTIAFTCPRCSLLVCESNCWDFEKLRCRLCVQNAVPLFPPSKQWWDQNIGLTTQQGRCQRCQAGPEEAELRTCPKCGRPQCLECWDDGNGVCTRCGWRTEALPAALKQFMEPVR
jgi:hypothetical protein